MTNRIPCAVTTALVLIACNQSVDIDTAADASRIAQASIIVATQNEVDIEKILDENLLRVWTAVKDYAATTSSST